MPYFWNSNSFWLWDEFLQISSLVLVEKHVLCVGLHVYGRHHLPKDYASWEIMVNWSLWVDSKESKTVDQSRNHRLFRHRSDEPRRFYITGEDVWWNFTQGRGKDGLLCRRSSPRCLVAAFLLHPRWVSLSHRSLPWMAVRSKIWKRR